MSKDLKKVFEFLTLPFINYKMLRKIILEINNGKQEKNLLTILIFI
jgi:hypothetical protein